MMTERISQWFDLGPVTEIFLQPSSVFILLGLVLLIAARFLKEKVSAYALDQELTERDNKAVAVENAGFFLAVLLLIAQTYQSSTTGEESPLYLECFAAIGWSLFAVVLLLVSAWINDRFLLHSFCNTKELVEDRNVGTGAVIAGSYLASAFIIGASFQGGSLGNLWLDVLDTLVYFTVGQVAFLALGVVYQKGSKFDVHAEIEKDNIAAGVAFGAHLLAMGMILGSHILRSDSLVSLAVWAVLGMVSLLATRVLVDRLLLPKSPLDHEIQVDRNWGAALIEGVCVIGLAVLINASYA